MKNNSSNTLTNSRVGRKWPKETSNDTEQEVDPQPTMHSKENSSKTSRF